MSTPSLWSAGRYDAVAEQIAPIAGAVVDAAPGKTVYWLPDRDEAARVLEPRLRPDDLVLVLGAGNVDAVGRALVS